MCKVHAYLVGAPRVQRKFRKCHVLFVKARGNRCGIFAAFADAALNYAAFLAGNGRFNNAFCGSRKFCRNAKVFFTIAAAKAKTGCAAAWQKQQARKYCGRVLKLGAGRFQYYGLRNTALQNYIKYCRPL